MSARNRELLALIPVAVLVTAGFTAVFIVESNQIGDLSLIYGAYFLAVCLAAHLVIRSAFRTRTLPVPALRAARRDRTGGLYRIDEELAVKQASLFVLGAGLFAATILPARLPRPRALPLPDRDGGILLLMAPRCPGSAARHNGAYLGLDLGPLSFQPAEVAKICIVIFLASYLAEKRELLSVAARRIAGLTIPRSSTSARCWSSGARRC